MHQILHSFFPMPFTSICFTPCRNSFYRLFTYQFQQCQHLLPWLHCHLCQSVILCNRAMFQPSAPPCTAHQWVFHYLPHRSLRDNLLVCNQLVHIHDYVQGIISSPGNNAFTSISHQQSSFYNSKGASATLHVLF